MAVLRESVEMESRADLMAVAGNFGEAAALMNRANRIRRQQFGPFDPNALRDLFTINDGDKQGVAVRARTYLDNYTKTGGILQGRADAIDKGVKLLKDEIKRWEEEILPKREERLRAQFLNLEKSMSTLQNQGNWMSQQIKSLGGFSQNQ